MNQETLIYTLPQWFIFAAVISSIYGWAEHKQVFRIIGPAIFIALGIFSGYAIYSGYFSTYNFLTPEEMIDEELSDKVIEELPFQAQLLPAYIAFIVAAAFAVPALIYEWKGRRPRNLFTITTIVIALLGFFIIVGALRSL